MKTDLHWLAPRKQERVPVTFGAPWAKGTLQKDAPLALRAQDGAFVPVQTKNTAYWPDGSIKWTAHSAVLDTSVKGYQIVAGQKGAQGVGLAAAQDAGGAVTVTTDRLSCTIAPGGDLVSSLNLPGQKPMRATLLALIETVQEQDGDEVRTTRQFKGQSQKVTLEEAGPLRAVVRVQGVHAGNASDARALFPFSVRLYFYQGTQEVRIVHTFEVDLDESRDLLKGIAVRLHMNASGELFNRHVGFTGDPGMFYEGVQGMYTGGGSWQRGDKIDPGKVAPYTMEERAEVYAVQQKDGRFVQVNRQEQPEFCTMVDDNAAWNDFRLTQHTSDSYQIAKRATDNCAFIHAVQGGRSKGGVFFGSEAGIVTAVVKDFWQKAPMALEVCGARGDAPTMTLWLWSKYAEAMDFRAYDEVSHFYSYGGINNVPQGIANTNEIFLCLQDAMPGKQAILDFADDVQSDSLLVAAPEVYEQTAALGSYWIRPQSPELKDTPQEKGVYNLTRYYMDEVERRRWYGFWDYGDIMHTYDPVRHCWRYDVGGYAWNNNELLPTYSSWICFLRTGEYDYFRYAKAMSRHCSDVDTYHSGTYAMLGNRHNVRHWGCGAKEPRISMAGHFRFYYYLTADERVGDVMDEVKDVDFATLTRDPMGSYFPPHETYSHVRVGPDWSSFVINWLTRWERFEDEAYRDKLLRSLDSVLAAPLGLSSGSTFHYDPTTGLMHYMGAENPAGHTHLGDGNYQQHMVICFGGPEIWFELAEILDSDDLRDNIARFGRFYAMTPEERKEASGGRFNEENAKAWSGLHFAADMCAYAGYRLGDKHCMDTAFEIISMPERMKIEQVNGGIQPAYSQVPTKDSPIPLVDAHIFTGGTARWSLNVVETLHFMDLLKRKA